MSRTRANISRLAMLLLALNLVLLMAMPAFAASGASAYDDDGNPVDSSQRLQALQDSGGSTQADRESGVDSSIEDLAQRSWDDGTIHSMEETRQKLQDFRDSYYGEDGESSQRAQQDLALGESEQYTDIDASRIFGSDGSQSLGLINAGSEILNIIVNAILLPAAILVVSWKTLYIGIFPILAGVDPLKMVSGQSQGTRRGSASGDVRGMGQKMIGEEVKKLIFGLLIVFIVWIIIRVGVLIAVTVLSMF